MKPHELHGRESEVISAYLMGDSAQVIAQRLGCAKSSILRLLHREKIVLRKSDPPRKPWRVLIHKGKRWCSLCKTWKEVCAFSKCKRSRDGYQSYCKSCATKRHRKWKYGIPDEEYQRRLEMQHGLCAICGRIESQRIRGRPADLVVDHDHKTGQIRQLLCQACNRLLGAVQDDPQRLRVAADYLEKHQTGTA